MRASNARFNIGHFCLVEALNARLTCVCVYTCDCVVCVRMKEGKGEPHGS